ncbi:hypothetical protein KCU95_g14047, partial [Aureobasidium melanogenum]
MLVRSTLASRAVAPLDFGYKTYSLNPDPRRALLSLAEAVDVTNINIAEGVPVDTSCLCTTAQSVVEYHPCAVCLEPTLCRSLAFNDDGVRVCPQCVEDNAEVERQAKAFVTHQIKVLTRLEANISGRDYINHAHQRNLQKCIDELVEGLPDQSGGPCYFDGFTDKEVVKIPIEIATFGRRVHPDTMSIDAKFLRVHADGIGLMGHVSGNVHTTRDPVNCCKSIWAPGVLELLTRWLRAAEDDRRNAHKLMQEMTDIQILACKTPYWTATRNAEKLDSASLERERLEVISGRPSPDEHGQWEEDSERWVYGSVHALTTGDEDSYTWPLEPRTGLLQVTTGCEEQFGVRLQRAPDGSPYVGLNTSTLSNLNGSMEVGYGWNSIAVFSQERRERMRILCNRRHLTEDSAYALFAEMIRSACVDQACLEGRCPEPDTHLFHLPKCLKVKHPLRLSVAHKHHGHQMITGWPTEPSDVNQRNAEINNILMETWMENTTKRDLDEKFYELLREIFQRLAVPRDLYDPSVKPPTGIDQSLAQVTNVDRDAEVFIGPTAKPTAEDGADDSTSAPAPGSASAPAPGSASAPAAGSTSRPSAGSTGNTLTYRLSEADYQALVAEGIVGQDSVFYGRVLVVNGQTGYAHADGNFRTTSGAIVGKFDEEGNYFPLAGKFVPPPKPYTGDLRLARMVYHQQIASLVDEASSTFDIVLVNSLGTAAFASTSGDFVTESGEIFGHFDSSTGVVTDGEGLEIGNISSIEGAKYSTADEMLADGATMQLTPFSHDEQVKALTSSLPGDATTIQHRIQALVPQDHVLYGQALTTSLGGDMLVAFPFKDNVFRNAVNDDIVAVVRESGILDVNGNTINTFPESSSEGDEGGDSRPGGTEQRPLVAVAQAFSAERNELSRLVPVGTAMDGIVVHRRNEAGDVEIAYPTRLFQFMLPQAPGENLGEYARTVAFYEEGDKTGNIYVIRDEENSVIAQVRRAEKGAAWKLIQTTDEP